MKHRWQFEEQKKSDSRMDELLWVFSDEVILAMREDLKKVRPSLSWKKDYESVMLQINNEIEARGL